MKLRVFLVVLVFLSISYSFNCISKENWVCYIDKDYPLEKSEPLEFFCRNILLPDNYQGLDYDLKHCKKLSGKITFIGLVQDKKIYDVIYALENEMKDVIKLVIVEREKGLFSPIYVFHVSKYAAEIYPSSIEKTDHNNTILIMCSLYYGTGNNYDEQYFLIDEYPPKRLDLNETLFSFLEKILPEGYGIWKGGGFNLKTLTYQSPVWKEGDGNCCPSGGWILIKFEIKENEFIINNYKFEKDSKCPPWL